MALKFKFVYEKGFGLVQIGCFKITWVYKRGQQHPQGTKEPIDNKNYKVDLNKKRKFQGTILHFINLF